MPYCILGTPISAIKSFCASGYGPRRFNVACPAPCNFYQPNRKILFNLLSYRNLQIFDSWMPVPASIKLPARRIRGASPPGGSRYRVREQHPDRTEYYRCAEPVTKLLSCVGVGQEYDYRHRFRPVAA
jgi:hypothetical protein